jgi:hypothetical protein
MTILPVARYRRERPFALLDPVTGDPSYLFNGIVRHHAVMMTETVTLTGHVNRMRLKSAVNPNLKTYINSHI